MKILVQNVQTNLITALRRCGYHFEKNLPETGEVSAARALGVDEFPRFHCYAKYADSKKSAEINLHLDQKRPIYKGVHAHAGEYEGVLVEREAERIKTILSASPQTFPRE